MFKFRILALTAIGLCAMQSYTLAQAGSPTPNQTEVTSNMSAVAAPVPAICPIDPGPALPLHPQPVVSEPRLTPAPIPGIMTPMDTDKVITPSPTPGKEPIVILTPSVQPSLVPVDLQKPITLDQGLEIAFRNNPDIRIALDQVEKARGVINETDAHFAPTLNASISGTIQGPTATVQFGGQNITLVPGTTGAANLSFLLPLDVSNRLGYSSEIATNQFQVQYLVMLSVSERLILNVRSAYYDLLRACGQREVAQSAVDVANLRLQNTEAKQKAGTVAVFDLRTAQVDLANLNQQLIAAQNSVYIAQAVFNRVLGVDVNNPTQVVGSTIPVTISSVDIPKYTNVAYARRPEVKAAQSAITLSKTNIKLQKTGLLPSMNVSAGANYGFQASGLNPSTFSWLGTLSLSFPLWDGGVTHARVRQARADEQNSVDTLEQTKFGVAQEVRSAALNLQNAALRTQATADVVSLAAEALRLANVRYDAGIAVLVEVTNAESQLTQAKFNYVNAQYDYATALAQLQRATSSQPELDRLQLLTGKATARQIQEVRH